MWGRRGLANGSGIFCPPLDNYLRLPPPLPDLFWLLIKEQAPGFLLSPRLWMCVAGGVGGREWRGQEGRRRWWRFLPPSALSDSNRIRGLLPRGPGRPSLRETCSSPQILCCTKTTALAHTRARTHTRTLAHLPQKVACVCGLLS